MNWVLNNKHVKNSLPINMRMLLNLLQHLMMMHRDFKTHLKLKLHILPKFNQMLMVKNNQQKTVKLQKRHQLKAMHLKK